MKYVIAIFILTVLFALGPILAAAIFYALTKILERLSWNRE